MRRHAYVIAVAIVSWHAPANATEPASAREQLKLGYLLAQEGKCAEAIPHLTESLRLDPKAITIINLADCEEKVGKLADAMGHWVDARARARVENQRPIEEEATTRLGSLEPRLARLTIHLSPTAPAGAFVERDGVVLGAPSIGIALPIDPGAHSVVVKAPGREERRTQLTLAEGEVKRVDVEAGPAVAPSSPPAAVPPTTNAASPTASTSPLVFVGFGVAAVGAAIGAVTGTMSLGAASDAERACPNLSCSATALDDVATGRTLGTVSTVAFVVAGAAAALGTYALVWGGTRREPKANVSLSPVGPMLRATF